MGVKTRNLGNSEGKDIQWQAPLNADGSTIFNLEAGKGYFINTTGGEVELKLPTGSIGDRIAIVDFGGTFNTNKIRLNLNGQKLNGSTNPSGGDGAQNYVAIETQNARLELVFSDSDKGWVVFENEAKTSPTGAPFAQFIEATGGTTTTSGNFKIHTFTADSNFVVSNAGNAAGSNTVSYVVVAGGGGGGAQRGGGGGAGGFREGKCSSDPYSDSPLDAGSGIEVTATTFPITVGGGGAAGSMPKCNSGSDGSNSVFSTITSKGGGGGGAGPAGGAGRPGGSGGGSGSIENPGSGDAPGNGNTPPVSPAQGTNGGPAGPGPTSGGETGAGGGGATQAGQSNPATNTAGDGGDGATTSITGSPTAYAGGGAGGNGTNTPTSGGGSGGGGPGGGKPGVQPYGTQGQAGTANLGGGGGGGGDTGPAGGAGGKGVVILRYKFQ